MGPGLRLVRGQPAEPAGLRGQSHPPGSLDFRARAVRDAGGDAGPRGGAAGAGRGPVARRPWRAGHVQLPRGCPLHHWRRPASAPGAGLALSAGDTTDVGDGGLLPGPLRFHLRSPGRAQRGAGNRRRGRRGALLGPALRRAAGGLHRRPETGRRPGASRGRPFDRVWDTLAGGQRRGHPGLARCFRRRCRDPRGPAPGGLGGGGFPWRPGCRRHPRSDHPARRRRRRLVGRGLLPRTLDRLHAGLRRSADDAPGRGWRTAELRAGTPGSRRTGVIR